MNELVAQALEASLANREDKYEIDLVADVASVGITRPTKGTDRKIEWKADVLEATAESLVGMPVNLKLNIDDEGNATTENHTNTIVGRVTEAYFDKARNKMLGKAKLWKHYFPETMQELGKMFDKGKVQTSVEFMPSKMSVSENDPEADTPLEGRFIGLGITDDGADTGNFVYLLASAKKEEAAKKLEEARQGGTPLPGSYEWIGEQVVTHLTASASQDDYKNKNILATYSDRTVWEENGTFYQIPYTIDRTSIKFGDILEVEQDFKPLSASIVEPDHEPKEADKPMAEISDTELQSLKASASEAETLKTELAALRASATENEAKLEEATTKLREAEEREEESRLEKLAASRMEEVEKIQKYDDADTKKDDLETFKTLDDKAFNMFKRALSASAAPKGGVANDGDAPKGEEDDEVKAILEGDNWSRLVASVSAPKEDK
jgi:hypothetical protein